MARILTIMLVLIISMAGLVSAGERHETTRFRLGTGLGNGAPLERRVYYPLATYYIPHYAPIWVTSPFGPWYHVPTAVVVTSPYFCVFHNHGFVSRVGLLDHLAGTHKIPLDAATTICPRSVGSCVFPSY